MAAKKRSNRNQKRLRPTARNKPRKKRKTTKKKQKKRPSETEGDKILAERLYSVREEQGVTRVVVAAETGIPYESLTGYELGDQRAPFSRIRVLAIYYGVSLDYFAGRTDRL
jgi:Helix-turn-helix